MHQLAIVYFYKPALLVKLKTSLVCIVQSVFSHQMQPIFKAEFYH